MIKVCLCRVNFKEVRCNSGSEYFADVADAFKIGNTYEYEYETTSFKVYVKEGSRHYSSWGSSGRPHYNFSLADFRDSFVDLNEYREFKLNQILS